MTDHPQAPPPTPLPKRQSVRKGRAGEVHIRSLLQRAGWRAGLQPGSGSVAARSDAPLRSGDIWAVCGEARLRIEVKHHKREPRALQTMRAGCEVLAYLCSETGRMAVFIDEGLFVDLLAWSAETLAPQNAQPVPITQRSGPRPCQQAGVVDGEIARARLEELVASADYPVLVQLERLARALQGRSARAALPRNGFHSNLTGARR
jgi:hypothetical protein